MSTTPPTLGPPYEPGTPAHHSDPVLRGLISQIRTASERLVAIVDEVRPFSRDDVWQGDIADRFVEDRLMQRKRLQALAVTLHDTAARLELRLVFPPSAPSPFESSLLLGGGSLGG